MAISETNGNSL